MSEYRPDLVLVHGDTSSSFAGALSAFYHQIPVGHIEAGLRSGNNYSPFPEEMNRKLTGQIAELHFAPTPRNKLNLEREGIVKNVFVTGNTVIDSFAYTVKENHKYSNIELQRLNFSDKRFILMTAHRRENFGEPLENICRAVRRIVEDFNDIEIVYPVHLNPIVRNTVYSILSGHERINLIEPIGVEDMHNLISRSYMLLTDSGGLQEEVPSQGIPVLVLRTETERPEAVETGTVKVIGVNEKDIYNNVAALLYDSEEYQRMKHAVNPYGDGHACERIIKHIKDWKNSR